MNLPQDAGVRLEAYLELLKRFTGFELQTSVQQITSAAARDLSPEEFLVEFTGKDEALLAANQGELLIAMESLAADFLELDGVLRQRVRFDSEQFRAGRERAIAAIVEAAAKDVRASGVPHVFAPMDGRDRRVLRRSLLALGLLAETFGAEPTRYVVLYPEGMLPPISDAPDSVGKSQALT